jgi:hypothetical protein
MRLTNCPFFSGTASSNSRDQGLDELGDRRDSADFHENGAGACGCRGLQDAQNGRLAEAPFILKP